MPVTMPDKIEAGLGLVHPKSGRLIFRIDHIPPAETDYAPCVTLWADPETGEFVGGRHTRLTPELLASVQIPAVWSTDCCDDRFA